MRSRHPAALAAPPAGGLPKTIMESRRTTVESIAKLLRLAPPWLFPGPLVEASARLGGWLLALVRAGDRHSMERALRGLLWSPRFRSTGLRIGRAVTIEGRRNLRLGHRVTLYGSTVLSCSRPSGHIAIGDGTHLDRQCVLHGQGGIEIGSGCAIASGVIIYSQTNRIDVAPTAPILDQATHHAEVTIGDDVWIGAGAIILPGVSIGDHAVVAAGAVVTRNVEPWQIVGGVPASRLRDRRILSATAPAGPPDGDA